MKTVSRSGESKIFRRPVRPHTNTQMFDRRKQNRQLDGTPSAVPTPKDRPDDSGASFRGRDPMCVKWITSLGHLLFHYPPVVMAMVNHWMSWPIFNHRSETGLSVEESFDTLVRSIVNDGIDLQIKLRRCQDAIMASSRMSYELSVMNNTDTRCLSEFAIGETILMAALNAVAEEPNEFRMRCVISYLFSDVHGKLFSHIEESPDNNGAHFRNFIHNDLIEAHQDHSMAFVALGIYIVNYMDQALSAEETAVVGDDDDAKRTANAACEAGRTLFNRYEEFVMAINERCCRISTLRLALPETLQIYAPESTDETLYIGVPIDVVQNEFYTLLWLKWIWEEHINQRGLPIKNVLQDLWTAKSAHHLDLFVAFFEDDTEEEGEERASGFDTYLERFADSWMLQQQHRQ